MECIRISYIHVYTSNKAIVFDIEENDETRKKNWEKIESEYGLEWQRMHTEQKRKRKRRRRKTSAHAAKDMDIGYALTN